MATTVAEPTKLSNSYVNIMPYNYNELSHIYVPQYTVTLEVWLIDLLDQQTSDLFLVLTLANL